MRSPLALKLTESPVVTGAENIRVYWQKAYGAIESADLKILNWSWDEAIARLTVWWQLATSEPASSWTLTGPAAWCAAKPSTENSHAISGFHPALQYALVRWRLHPVQH